MPTVSIVSTSPVLCVGNPATLTASGATNYTWSLGSNNASVVITPQGTATYTVTGKNTPCPVVSETLTIPVSPAIVLVANASSSIVCLGDSIVLSVTGANSYTWSNGANTASTIVKPTANVTYSVTGGAGPGCIAKKTIAITTNSVPVIEVSPLTQTTCPSKEVVFTASGANTYVWLPGGLNLPVFTDYPTVTRTYTVIGQAANTCSTAVEVTAIVEDCVGIKDQKGVSTGIRVFPNPSNGLITVAFDFDGSKEIQISNAMGALLSITTTQANSEVFDLSGFSKGIYFIKVISKQSSGTYRIILTD
jgi:hypothetical protein